MKRFAVVAAMLAAVFVNAQTPDPQAGPWAHLLNNLAARNVGPVNMSGRVTSLAVYEKAPRIFYVGSASGGVWRTDNAGVTFTPVFYKEASVSVGAVEVNQNNPDDVWVGTGEHTSRNSTAWGDGIYHSTDGGKTWTKKGLEETRHISSIVMHPKDPKTLYVGGLGRLWGPSEERGLYKTTDGGKTWKKILYVNDLTGPIDVQMDPTNPNTLLVAMWRRHRFPYNWISGGEGSGIYKTTDGGKTFRHITKGMPKGDFGRIGLSYFRKNPKIVIASVEHSLTAEGRRTSESGVYRSTDGGESWTKTASTNPRPFYFSVPRQDPSDENRVYMPAVNLHYSEDAGKTFRVMRTSVHVDHHAMWINPADNSHMIIGQDGGVGQTRDRGTRWEAMENLPLGQFYGIAFDMRKPYWVYGGLQDNGSWGVPTQTMQGGVSHYHAVFLTGGDGFHVQVDPNDWTTVYAESQGGGISRVDLRGGPSRSIRPRIEGERIRFNWSAPFIISPHNSRTLYMGGNRLFKTVNRGDAWRPISPDLTTNDPEKQKAGVGSVTPENTGAEVHCTIITISESPMKQGLVYVGTDDGLVWVTKDDGANWEQLTANIPDLPKNTWCSRVTASKWQEGRVYATFDGHRSNDFKPYVYASEDYGKTWTKLNGGLPDYDCVYVIKEGERNPDLLYLGSEMSLRVSFDRGKSWSRFRSGDFPTVAVHDLAIHPRELDLVIGTHGRAIWTLDVSALEQMTTEARGADAAIFRPQNVYLLGRVGGGGQNWPGDRGFMSPNTQPGTNIQYVLKSDVAGDVKVIISDVTGQVTQELTGTGKAGLNVVRWNGRLRNRQADAGDYRVTLKVGDKEYITSVKVEDLSLQMGN